MGLISGQGSAAEAEPFLQARQRRGALIGSGIRPEDPVEARRHKILEGGFPDRGGHLGPMQQVVGQINGRLHWQ